MRQKLWSVRPMLLRAWLCPAARPRGGRALSDVAECIECLWHWYGEKPEQLVYLFILDVAIRLSAQLGSMPLRAALQSNVTKQQRIAPELDALHRTRPTTGVTDMPPRAVPGHQNSKHGTDVVLLVRNQKMPLTPWLVSIPLAGCV